MYRCVCVCVRQSVGAVDVLFAEFVLRSLSIECCRVDCRVCRLSAEFSARCRVCRLSAVDVLVAEFAD